MSKKRLAGVLQSKFKVSRKEARQRQCKLKKGDNAWDKGHQKRNRRRMVDAGLNAAEVDQLLDTGRRAFQSARRRAPSTWGEGGVSTPKPAREIFSAAHQAIMQQPKPKGEPNND